MDFMNRGNRPVQQNTHSMQPAEGPAGAAPAHKTPGARGSKFKNSSKWAKLGYALFVVAVTVLIVALVFSFVFAKDTSEKESDNINRDQFQAVFLNGGQVYFGKIDSLNSKYLSMDNIYYLRVNQQVQPNQSNNTNNANDISLVKLGCELHGPEDSMVIYREQVIFWENLKKDGQVAKAIDAYVKENPNGQKCETNTTGSTNNTTTPTTGNTTTGTGTTTNPAPTTSTGTGTSTTTKKP